MRCSNPPVSYADSPLYTKGPLCRAAVRTVSLGCSGAAMGAPGKPSVSGFTGERRSSGMSELLPSRQNERYGACDDVGIIRPKMGRSLSRHSRGNGVKWLQQDGEAQGGRLRERVLWALGAGRSNVSRKQGRRACIRLPKLRQSPDRVSPECEQSPDIVSPECEQSPHIVLAEFPQSLCRACAEFAQSFTKVCWKLGQVC